MNRGRFITFEGGEGTGKSTQVKLLGARLRDAGIDVLETREPGGSPGAEQIRALLVSGATDRWQPMTETLLHYAARIEHVARTVTPALDAGQWVISDRFADSTIAYQGYGHRLGAETVEALHRIALGDTAPDLTFILDLPVDAGLARAAGRDDAAPEDRYERMGEGFHARVREGFLAIAEAHPDRCKLVDANASPDAVHHAVWQAVQAQISAPSSGAP